MGYHQAGFEVVGVDINPQPNYPFEFHRGDALEFLAAHGHEFDAVHASPPCQASCALTKGSNKDNGVEYINLIPQTRAALARLDVPTIIENVIGSDLRRDLTLCGLMFGLKVFRHRYFELGGWIMDEPVHPSHKGHRVSGWRHGVKHDGDMVAVYGDGGGKGSVAEWQQAMGIFHTDVRKEIAEAIPPAYSEFIGNELIAILEEETNAA
jgi:DNA (cytosine-5)-methyltransferase 1